MVIKFSIKGGQLRGVDADGILFIFQQIFLETLKETSQIRLG